MRQSFQDDETLGAGLVLGRAGLDARAGELCGVVSPNQHATAGPIKVLFVCSRNEIRSLTAERMLAGVPNYAARSAGTESGARVRVTAGHLGWADLVFVMEKRYRQRLTQKFAEALVGKTVVCLHIPDDYDYMDTALVATLRARLAGHLVLPVDDDDSQAAG